MTTSREPLSLKALIFIGLLFALSLCGQAPDPSSFSLAPGDITEAIVDTSTPARLKVLLTQKKSAELTAFTELNLNKQASIVVAGKVRSQPLIRERMTGPSMELYVTSAEDALATVKALLTANLKFEQLHTWTDGSGQTHYAEKLPDRSPSDLPPPAGKVSDFLRDDVPTVVNNFCIPIRVSLAKVVQASFGSAILGQRSGRITTVLQNIPLLHEREDIHVLVVHVLGAHGRAGQDQRGKRYAK